MSSRIVAQHLVDGMVLSNANIYFTAHDGAGATVFRTAQSATPGHEADLCHEPGCRFGDIVFAKVDDVSTVTSSPLPAASRQSGGFRSRRNRVR